MYMHVWILIHGTVRSGKQDKSEYKISVYTCSRSQSPIYTGKLDIPCVEVVTPDMSIHGLLSYECVYIILIYDIDFQSIYFLEDRGRI